MNVNKQQVRVNTGVKMTKLKFKLNSLFKIILSTFLVFSLSACWNYLDLDQITIVAGIGIDEGEEKKYCVSIETIIVDSGEKESKTKSSLLECEGDTIWEGLSGINSKLPTKLYYGDVQVLAISEDLARAGKLEEILESFFRDSERRETVDVIISGNKTARRLIAADSKKGDIVSYQISDNGNKNKETTGYSFCRQTYELYNDITRKASDIAIPIYRMAEEEEGSSSTTTHEINKSSSGQKDTSKEGASEDDSESGGQSERKNNGNGEPQSDEKTEKTKEEDQKETGEQDDLNKKDNSSKEKKDKNNGKKSKQKKEKIIKTDGCALFNKEQMVGKLGYKDVTFLSMITNKTKKASFTFKKDEDKFVGISVYKTNSKIQHEFKDGKLSVKIKIKSKVAVTETDENVDFLKKDEKEKFLSSVTEEMKQRSQKMIKRCQELNSEPFGIATNIYKKNHKLWEEIKDNWKEIYKNTNIEVIPNVEIINTGFVTKYK